ncbi:MAG: paraquat-inducible protein A [Defluviicoccus sp.]
MDSRGHGTERPIFCHECGLHLRAAPLPEGATAKCPRCGAFLFRHRTNSIERSLSLLVAALILFVIAQTFPFMTLKMEGREQLTVLLQGSLEFYRQGLWPLAVLVFFATTAAPLLKMGALLWVLVPLHHGRQPRHGGQVFRLAQTLRPWAMMEVYLLGVFVAYVKLIDMATLELGTGLFAFGILIFVMSWADSALEPAEVWDRLKPSAPVPAPPQPAPGQRLIGCHACDLVVPVAGDDHARCPRCGSALHARKVDSIGRTWALVLTALILYVPANLFPVMTVISFGSGEPDTILSGVEVLIESGMWPLALLVFMASITVPMLKLAGLSFLLISVQRRSSWRRRDRTRLYRIIEGVGRWSMIDIFMISILVALVKLGAIATIEPGVGATSFAAVVVTTMLASMAFDPRLIWDAAAQERTTT